MGRGPVFFKRFYRTWIHTMCHIQDEIQLITMGSVVNYYPDVFFLQFSRRIFPHILYIQNFFPQRSFSPFYRTVDLLY